MHPSKSMAIALRISSTLSFSVQFSKVLLPNMDCDVLRQVIAVNLRTALKLVGVVRDYQNSYPPASFLFPALPSFLRSFLQNLHLSFSVFLSPLFGHCICNTRKCFCSVLGPVSRKHTFVLLSMLFAVRARRTPCCNRCHNVCWKQRWQIF